MTTTIERRSRSAQIIDFPTHEPVFRPAWSPAEADTLKARHLDKEVFANSAFLIAVEVLALTPEQLAARVAKAGDGFARDAAECLAEGLGQLAAKVEAIQIAAARLEWTDLTLSRASGRSVSENDGGAA